MFSAAYGGADALKVLAAGAAKDILITVQVSGDAGGRVVKGFAAFFTERGFRTTAAPGGAYLLSARLETERVEFGQDARYQWVRYVLTASLVDRAGKEVFAYSGNGREGHTSVSLAQQRVLQRVEESITSGDFAGAFDAHLASLLK